MGASSKPALMDSPPDYVDFPLPKIPCCPAHLKKLLCVVLIIVVIVIIIMIAIMMGLFMTQKHTESIFQMSLFGQDGKSSQVGLPTHRKEGLAVFHITTGGNSSATVVYDYSNLIICYRPWPGQACLITRMNEEDIPSLEAFNKDFHNIEIKLQSGHPRHHGEPDLEKTSRKEGSSLGTTIRVLCSGLPLIWV